MRAFFLALLLLLPSSAIAEIQFVGEFTGIIHGTVVTVDAIPGQTALIIYNTGGTNNHLTIYPYQEVSAANADNHGIFVDAQSAVRITTTQNMRIRAPHEEYISIRVYREVK